MAFMRITTPSGHSMAVVYSCFQKYVRRGDFEGALYWGAQIAVAAEGYKGFPNALKKRLMQHALEDVGHLDYALLLNASKGVKSWDDLVPWIRLLCELPKTRAAAWLNRVAVQHVGDADIPTKLLRDAADALTLHAGGRRDVLEARFGTPALRLYRELNDEVLVFHCALLTAAGVVAPAALPTVLPLPRAAVPAEALATAREVPDWAYDKHTAQGKRLGRGYAHFFETMVVAPRLFAEGADPFEVEARALYTDGAEQRVRHILAARTAVGAAGGAGAAPAAAEAPIAAAGATPTLEGYSGWLQAQPITGAQKPRVWFAVDGSGAQVVVKGPVVAAECAACMRTEDVKKRLGLPHTSMRIVHSGGGAYLVQNSLADYTKFATHTVTTKLETATVPVDDAAQAWHTRFLGNTEQAYGLLEALLMRKVVGANDTCKRNFLVCDGTVYSIDDASRQKPTPYMWKTRLVKEKADYVAALRAAWPRLTATIERWRPLLCDDAYAAAQLEAHATLEGWRWE